MGTHFFFFPVMTLKSEVTADGHKIRELVFDNTKDVRSLKVYWCPDTFTKDYNFVQTWQIDGGLYDGAGSGSWHWELQRGDVSVHKYTNDWSWYNKADKVEMEMKVDPRTSPYTMVWYQPSSGHLFPCVKHLLGQDEVSMNVWHTPGTELKITTNLPHIQSFSVTTTDTTRKMELNGKESVTVDYTPGSHSISQTGVTHGGTCDSVSILA